MTPAQYMAVRIAQIDKQIDALGGVNKEKCELFYEALISRQKDWSKIMAGVIAEYLTMKDEYLCKP